MNILKVNSQDDLTEIFKLRAHVWMVESGNKKITKNKFWEISSGDSDQPQWMIPDIEDKSLSVVNFMVKENNKVVASAKISIYQSIYDADELLEVYGNQVLENEENVNGKVAYLTRLVVHPEWRGKGLAKMLNNARIDYAKKNFCNWIFSSATEKNSNILTSMGFKKSPISITRYFEQNNSIQTLFLMSKNIGCQH